MASIFASLGFEGVVFSRLDYRDHEERRKTKNMELLWQGSENLGRSSEIFTSILYDMYSAPRFFCWDVLCGDTPINNDEESPDFNAIKRVSTY